MPRTRRPLLLALALLASSVAFDARATTVVPVPFDKLVDYAREIFVGEAVASSSRFVDTPQGRAIVTLVTFRIDDSIKGGLQTQTSLEFLGGQVGDVGMAIAEMPRFHVGDRDVLFVGSRTDISPLVGFMYGRVRIVHDAVLNVDTVRMYNGAPMPSLDAFARPQTPTLGPVRSLSLADFRAAVRARVGQQAGRQP